MTVTRREFLKMGAATGAALFLPSGFVARKACADFLTPTLAPTGVAKYVTPLVVPPVMPATGRIRQKGGKWIDYYEIAVRQFQQQILPAGLPATTVWGYGSANHPGTFHYPAFTIESKWKKPVRVKWINGLIGPDGNYLPHLLPVDQTLHWANPPGGEEMRDMHGTDPAPYAGPVPIVTHVHGAHTTEESDGYPEAWFLPAADDIPAGYAPVGTWYDTFREESEVRLGQAWEPGSAVFQYPNNQRATALWYHDHTLGMTRLNVYAGPAGFYLLRGGPGDEVEGLPGPAPKRNSRAGRRYYEIPLAIQDRAFNLDGSLFYPDSREYFDEHEGPYLPDSDIPPIWNPEFFGNAMVVNGKTWPYLTVEPRRYRFRVLNGCNSRFIILKLVTGDPAARPGVAALPLWQIGSEGGCLPAPVQLSQLLMAPAERADVVVDFSGLPKGTQVFLINEGPDEPFGGGVAGTDFPYADPQSTGQVMKFVVGALTEHDTTVPPDQLVLPPIAPLGPGAVVRDVTLNEEDSELLEEVGPRAALLGTLADGPLMWMDPVTENPALNATEVWNIHNFTMDAHPIHIHEIMFQVLGRTHMMTGTTRPPEATELGWKDTVIAYPDEVTTIAVKFDIPGRFVWHCHIVEHEDNEMMRPLQVGPLP